MADIVWKNTFGVFAGYNKYGFINDFWCKTDVPLDERGHIRIDVGAPPRIKKLAIDALDAFHSMPENHWLSHCDIGIIGPQSDGYAVLVYVNRQCYIHAWVTEAAIIDMDTEFTLNLFFEIMLSADVMLKYELDKLREEVRTSMTSLGQPLPEEFDRIYPDIFKDSGVEETPSV